LDRAGSEKPRERCGNYQVTVHGDSEEGCKGA
jgi:hypothetical protein